MHAEPGIRRAAALLALLPLLAAPLPARAEEPRVVEITAHRFAFEPPEVTLPRGRPALLRLHSQDVTHGFFSRPLGIDTVIPPGRVTEVAITPREPGRYTVICDHFCGSGHGNMKMTIVVE
jgi:cytochrome c oxidase subunit II